MVVGLGNVALDVARMLLTPVDILKVSTLKVAKLDIQYQSISSQPYINVS